MYVGYVVHLKDQFDGGDFCIGKRSTVITVNAMAEANPGETICLTPVTEIPEWVEQPDEA